MQTKKITSTMVGELFTIMPLENDTERIIYSEKYINAKPETVEHDLYELVSTIAYNSGISFEFSYEIMSRACDVVAEIGIEVTTDTDDGLHEMIDNSVPVYNHELLKIANPADYHYIDTARDEYGGEMDTIQACSLAWFTLIRENVQTIVEKIAEYNNDNA